MFQRLKNNISHPKLAFLYLKDKFLRVFSYFLILSLIMSLPIIFTSIISPTTLIPSSKTISYELNYTLTDDFVIEDNKLITNDKSEMINLGVFNITFGEKYYETQGYFISFKEEEISIYYNFGQGATFKTNKYEYNDIKFGDGQLNKNNSKDISVVINNLLVNDKTLITGLTLSQIFMNIFDLLIIILMLSLIAVLTKRLPFKFSEHFKINTYIATIYAVGNLILTLFSLSNLNLLLIIIVYIYQMIAYRSVKIITKLQVKNKDE